MKVKPAERPGRVLIEIGPEEPKLMAQATTEVVKLKNILVPVDFSEGSDKAITYAIAFARQFRVSLTLLHVVQVPYGAGEAAVIDFKKYKDEMDEESRKRLAALAKRMPGSIKTRTVTRLGGGSAYDVIIRVAKELETDLIIISTHGRSGLKRFFMGSTTEKVVRHAPCPVLVVRDQEHEFVEVEEKEEALTRK